MQRTGIIFGGAPSVPEMVAAAREAEERGFESVWVAETRVTRDGVVPLAAIAAATERVRVGSGIVNVYTRGPVVLAITFRTLAEIAPGRVVMGLGAGSPSVLARQGVSFDRPLRRLREHVAVIPALLRGEEVTFHGETVTVEAARIEDASPDDPRIPLYLGVTGPRALELAGETADGALLNICLPPEYVRRARERIAAGAARAGRDPAAVDAAMAIVCSPHEDGAEGRDRARPFVTIYLALFPNIARETGLPPDLLERVRSTFATEGLPAAMRLVGDDVVDRLCAAGTPEECRERIAEYRAAGVDLPVLTPVDGALGLTLRALS